MERARNCVIWLEVPGQRVILMRSIAYVKLSVVRTNGKLGESYEKKNSNAITDIDYVVAQDNRDEEG